MNFSKLKAIAVVLSILAGWLATSYVMGTVSTADLHVSVFAVAVVFAIAIS